MTEKGRYSRRAKPPTDAQPVRCVRCRTTIAAADDEGWRGVAVRWPRAGGGVPVDSNVWFDYDGPPVQLDAWWIRCRRCGTEHLVDPNGDVLEASRDTPGDLWPPPNERS